MSARPGETSWGQDGRGLSVWEEAGLCVACSPPAQRCPLCPQQFPACAHFAQTPFLSPGRPPPPPPPTQEGEEQLLGLSQHLLEPPSPRLGRWQPSQGAASVRAEALSDREGRGRGSWSPGTGSGSPHPYSEPMLRPHLDPQLLTALWACWWVTLGREVVAGTRVSCMCGHTLLSPGAKQHKHTWWPLPLDPGTEPLDPWSSLGGRSSFCPNEAAPRTHQQDWATSSSTKLSVAPRPPETEGGRGRWPVRPSEGKCPPVHSRA